MLKLNEDYALQTLEGDELATSSDPYLAAQLSSKSPGKLYNLKVSLGL